MTADVDLTRLSIAGITRVLRSAEATATEVVDAHLERIARVDGEVRSFVVVLEERARRRAAALDATARRGEWAGPLHGVPIALKDAIDVAGVRTTMGSRAFRDRVAGADAWVVQRLEGAGAVVLGKNSMDELALGVTGASPLFPTPRNPWSVDRISGGSSGGTAAAVAAGLCVGGVGTDTGGSIRVPASLCGVVGLKPTAGRVSVTGVMPLSWSLDHVGPLGRSVDDVRRLLAAMEGYDEDDPASVDRSRLRTDGDLDPGGWRRATSVEISRGGGRGSRDGIEGWRIGLAVGDLFAPVDPEVAQAVEAAGPVLEELGARVSRVPVDVDVPGGVVSTEAAVLFREQLETSPEVFGDGVLALLRKGLERPAPEYASARRGQVLLRRYFERVLRDVDLLVTPTTPLPAPRHGSHDERSLARRLTSFTAVFNLVGLPAVSLPCGASADGLPIGMQIVGRPWGDMDVLHAAEAFESVAGLPGPAMAGA